ncbi:MULTISPECIES: MFS transporter [unclassified Flavobacterium]|uniref:MFS transporter n=1 Tax=unclassified Flavobacterium TaxID=196869 RepID=UPI00095FF112|nr:MULTISPECIES: MFS transporter [unclassified Flavobacterium]MBN9286031.1 MFS transporter [Flavobacterium sp.]OJV69085.1 MAG: MFS transporter [Flavobacterium sp. 40-81]
MKRFLDIYLDSYRGLSKPAWMLALVIFINRSGAMVLPFLGIYMTEALHFSLKEAGTVLSCFGLGAVTGSWLGGWLTDKVGHFKVQTVSLLLSVPMFCLLPLFKTVETLAVGIFILSVITDSFRPANSVSVAYYAKPENITRAFSLNRMAINLGFSIGPALGGLLAIISYSWLFYGNAIGAVLAGLLFFFYFRNRKGNENVLKKEADAAAEAKEVSPYRDKQFIWFNILTALYAICFFQLLSTLPLFYKEIHKLTEADIGILLAYSGFVVFALEMLLVHIAERKMTSAQVIILGTILCGLSFIMLVLPGKYLVLYVSMFVLCISEILVMPFVATVTVQRSGATNRGAYMGFGALAYSAAHIVSPYLGTRVADFYGFDTLWIGTGVLTVFIAFGFYVIMKKM